MFMYSVQVAVLRTYTHSIFNKTEPSRGSNSPHLIALRDSAPQSKSIPHHWECRLRAISGRMYIV